MITIIACTALSFALGLFATYYMLRFAKKREIFDHPNERSLHSSPTPRGGGAATVLACIVGISIYWNGVVDLSVVIGPAALVAALSAWDDVKSLSARFRLMVQIAAAGGFSIVIFRQFAGADIFVAAPLYNQILVYLFFLLFLLWMANLFNFMDGADGLVGTQVITTMIPAMILIWGLGYKHEIFMLLPLVGAYLGFLVFNWNPAKIFMGDVGSVFTGFYIGQVAIILGAAYEPKIFWSIGTLCCGFIVDATYTLLVRFFRKQKVWEAHRTHAFQKLIRMGWSHSRVAFLYGAINLLWIVPVVLIASNISLYLMVILAGIPSLVLCIWTRAGTEAPAHLPGVLSHVANALRAEKTDPSY